MAWGAHWCDPRANFLAPMKSCLCLIELYIDFNVAGTPDLEGGFISNDQ